jgi:hypothetical protein
VAGGSWFTPGNWSTKAVPTSTDEACITTAGTYTVEMNGPTATIKALTVGASSGTQTLQIASTNSVNAFFATTAGISTGAHGVITLTNSETSGTNVTVAGPISNGGAIDVEKAHGGARTNEGNLTNTGTLAINQPTSFNAKAAVLTNEGALNVASGVQLVASNSSSPTNGAGGSIVAAGTGAVLIEPGTSFTENAGTTTGSKPVIVRDAALQYTGAGASLIAVHGRRSAATSQRPRAW